MSIALEQFCVSPNRRIVSMFIVSANYKDPHAKERWLVRGENDRLTEVQKVSSVTAQEVKFTYSTVEIGFGCSTVAKVETLNLDPTSNEPDKGEVKLRFGTVSFYTNENKPVESCYRLRLTPDGSMYAILEKPETTLSEEKPEETPLATQRK